MRRDHRDPSALQSVPDRWEPEELVEACTPDFWGKPAQYDYQ